MAQHRPNLGPKMAPRGGPKGGQRTTFFDVMLALGTQLGQDSPKNPPRAPKTPSKPRFWKVLGPYFDQFFCSFWVIICHLFCIYKPLEEARKQKEAKKRSKEKMNQVSKSASKQLCCCVVVRARWREGRRQVDILLHYHMII